MGKALIMYWHGLGDIIMLTPVLRDLHSKGYQTDLMCRQMVIDSHLLDDCEYINDIIVIENPWRSKLGFDNQAKVNMKIFNNLKVDYDFSAPIIHSVNFDGMPTGIDKVRRNIQEAKLNTKNEKLEVFIPKDVEKAALEYIKAKYPNGYIFKHTMIEFHKFHNWNSDKWIKDNLPDLPVVDTGARGNYRMYNYNVNFAFVLAREATHRILSSSVFVHACDAMDVEVEVIHFGAGVNLSTYLKNDIAIRIKEGDHWVKTKKDRVD